MLNVDRWPECTDPLLVVALSGWVDAGVAGAGALTAIAEQLDPVETFANFDLTDLCDLQQTRPTAHLTEGGVRVIEWPHISFVSGRAGGRDAVLVHGPEPSLRWPYVAGVIVDVATRLGVQEAATVGGIPALVSHRRPLPVLATATDRSLVQELGALRADYAGPTGLQTVVQRALGDAGIPCAALWAQVPQYVAGSTSPPAVRALLARIVELYRLDLDLTALDARCRAYSDRVEEGLAARPEVKEIVDRLDREQPSGAGGDELVSEIEQFLRSQSDPE